MNACVYMQWLLDAIFKLRWLRRVDTKLRVQARLNMRELLSGGSAINRQQDCAVASVMLHARDAALSHSLQTAAAQAGPGQTVAGVVGDAHVQGICQHWQQSLDMEQAVDSSNPLQSSEARDAKAAVPQAEAGRKQHSGSSDQAAHSVQPKEEDVLLGTRVALAESVLSLQVSLLFDPAGHSCSSDAAI